MPYMSYAATDFGKVFGILISIRNGMRRRRFIYDILCLSGRAWLQVESM